MDSRISIFIVTSLLILPGTVQGATIHVPDDCTTIQAAIFSADDGDTVIVAPGTYVENIDFLGKAINVKSEQGAAVTVIDGNQAGSVVTFQSGEGSDSVLEGFTVTNGTGTWEGYDSRGGGIYCTGSPTIQNNIIHGNQVAGYSGPSGYGQGFGGGMYSSGSSTTITNNIISGNRAGYNDPGGSVLHFGGGIYCTGSPTITDNTLIDNLAFYGGGMYCAGSSATIRGNNITGNIAVYTGGSDGGPTGGGEGGGMYCSATSTTITNNTLTGNIASTGGGGMHCTGSFNVIKDNKIMGNSAGYGGGIACGGVAPEFVNNRVSGNTAKFYGGVYCEGSSPTLANEIISGNTAVYYGGGISCSSCSNLTVLNCTLVDNHAGDLGGGMYINYSNAVVINTISWNNHAPLGPEIWVGGALLNPPTLTISFSDVEGGRAWVYVGGTTSSLYWGPGMIDANPMFLDPLNDDFHLSDASPCIDRGDNEAPCLPEFDMDGEPRILPGVLRYVFGKGMIKRVDIGADESSPPITVK